MTDGSRIAKPLRVVGAGDTHIGGREHNEDSILLRPDLDLFLVADGAGGHNAGNVASTLAAATVAHYFESTQDDASHMPAYDAMGLSWSARRLASAFQKANHEIIEVSQSSETKKGMGSTLVAAYFDLVHSTLVLGHVGDSRCYRSRGGRLERMTQDHTLINDVLEMKPDIDAAQAAALPRNVITNALGMDATVRVSVRTHEVAPGDLYVLCSDGLTDEVDDGQIQQALQLASTPEEAVRLLIDLAVENGARDNVGVVVVGCKLAPGVGKLPEKPVPPRRRYPEDAVLIASEDDDEESIEVLIIADPDDEDAPEIEIVRDRAATDAGRRRRRDETLVRKPDE
jgi:protein phosphatase